MEEDQSLQPFQSELARASQIADEIASRNVFADYRRGIASETRRRQDDDLVLFARYLHSAGVQETGDFANDADAWCDISGGLVKGFREWMIREGYAIGSINVRLSTVKRYAALAYETGMIDEDKLTNIKQVKLLRYTEGINIDKARPRSRVGTKKGKPVAITAVTAQQLKQRPDTPQGRRDAVLMCLLLDHGLRCSEVALLQVKHIHLEEGTFQFYRPKVHKQQTHELTRDSLWALKVYLERDKPEGKLLQASRKDDSLIDGSMSTRAITARVRALGEAVGVSGLSAHDCRHYWATTAARNKTDAKSLQTAGGWNSPVMPLRYIAESEIANKGVKLS